MLLSKISMIQRNFYELFYSCTKLTVSNSDVDKGFKSMHQSIVTRIKKCVCEN